MNGKHFWAMLVGCLVPLAGLGVAWALGVPLGILGIVALLIFCPLSHFFLMRGMRHAPAGQRTTPAGQVSAEEIKRPGEQF